MTNFDHNIVLFWENRNFFSPKIVENRRKLWSTTSTPGSDLTYINHSVWEYDSSSKKELKWFLRNYPNYRIDNIFSPSSGYISKLNVFWTLETNASCNKWALFDDACQLNSPVFEEHNFQKFVGSVLFLAFRRGKNWRCRGTANPSVEANEVNAIRFRFFLHTFRCRLPQCQQSYCRIMKMRRIVDIVNGVKFLPT
jgi:hypothetical protein